MRQPLTDERRYHPHSVSRKKLRREFAQKRDLECEGMSVEERKAWHQKERAAGECRFKGAHVVTNSVGVLAQARSCRPLPLSPSLSQCVRGRSGCGRL